MRARGVARVAAGEEREELLARGGGDAALGLEGAELQQRGRGAELVPADAGVEIAAKVFNGYEGGDVYKVDKTTLEKVVGRDYDYKKTDAEMEAQDGLDALKKSGAESAAEGEPAAKRAKSK